MHPSHAVLHLLLILLPLVVAKADSPHDFVIIGGGTAGLAVASRLSENADVQVLVIEAGYSALNVTDSTFPELRPTFSINYGSLDWNYTSEPQLTADGQPRTLAAGKGIGGTSLINGMIYLRAESAEIDAWERVGNEGWNWETVYPYYLKSELLNIPTQEQVGNGASFNPNFHGFEGPLHTGWPREAQQTDYFLAVKETFQKLGIPFNGDPGGGKMRGISTFPRTITPGNESIFDVRADSGRSYYYPVQDRPNLHMMTGTTALRLLWDSPSSTEDDAVARAVEVVDSSGERSVINATSEIIISCGAYRSPPLLENSGVGNPAILSTYGIEAVVNLPGVGENLIDQSLSPFFFNASAGSRYIDDFVNAAYLSISDLFGSNSSSFESSVRSSLPEHAKRVAEGNNGATTGENILKILQVQYDLLFKQGVPCMETSHTVSDSVLWAQLWGSLPFSRGNVHIRSSNPLDLPAIDPRYWQFQYDLSIHIQTARYIRMIYGNVGPLAGLVEREAIPGTENVPLDADDETWAAWLKANSRPVWHSVGSAAMLPRALGGVTSPRCKVWGTQNVRVVDTSIFPFQITGHPSSTVYAVAERCSDLIKEDHRTIFEYGNDDCWN